MSGPVGEKNGSYPFLNRFSTKTLRQLLREDFASKEPGTPESDAFITCVAEVIARREAAGPDIPRFDVEAGWRSLQKSCRPQDADAVPAGSDALPEGTAGIIDTDISRMAARWTRLQSGEEDPGASGTPS